MRAANAVLERLMLGNAEFVQGKMSGHESIVQKRFEYKDFQAPVAVILTCSDARVTPEYVFDQPLGALFVVRVAGNVAMASQIETVEFAVQHLDVPLLMVMGHTRCGAVSSSVDIALKQEKSDMSGAASSKLYEYISPVVHQCRDSEPELTQSALVDKAVTANVHRTVNILRHTSDFLNERCESGELKIVGAEYSFDTGKVSLFD